MLILKTFDFSDYLNANFINLQECVEFWTKILNEKNLYSSLILSSKIAGVSIVALKVENELKINICAVETEDTKLFDIEMAPLIQNFIKNSVEKFNDQYYRIQSQRIDGITTVDADDKFKKILRHLIKMPDENGITVGDCVYPIVPVDKTILVNTVTQFEAPTTGRGVAERYEFSQHCISITPTPENGKHYAKIDVLCNEVQSIEMIRASYQNKILYGFYTIEKIGENYYLVDWKLEQPNLL